MVTFSQQAHVKEVQFIDFSEVKSEKMNIIHRRNFLKRRLD
jgi:hypothetical protein